MNPTDSHRELEAPISEHTREIALGLYKSSPRPSYSEAIKEPNALYELWRTVLRNKGSIVLTATAGLIGAVVFSLVSTPLYRARAGLEIQDVNNDFLNTRQLSPTSEAPGLNTAVDLQTQLRIIQGDDLLDTVISELRSGGKLKSLDDECRGLNIWRTEPLTAAEFEARVHAKAAGSLAVRQLGQTKMLEVVYSSPDPKLAADFVNAVVRRYIDSGIEARWKLNGNIGSYLSEQLTETREKLQSSEKALQAYALHSGLLYTTPLSGAPEKTNVSEEKLRQLQESLSRAQADATAAQSHYAVARAAAPETVAEVLNDSMLRDLRAKLTDLSRQRAELTSIYTPKDEQVERVEAQIAPLQTAFDQERNSILASIQHEFETSQLRVKLLQGEFARQSTVVLQDANKSIEYNILRREVDSNRQIYNMMLEQVKQSTIASAIRASNVRVIDTAKPPLRPYFPKLPLNGAAGLLFGTIGGIVLVSLRQSRDYTVKAPGETRLWTSLPELGAIPIPDDSTNGSNRAVHRMPFSFPALFSFRPKEKQALRSPLLLTAGQESSVVGEAFRKVLPTFMPGREDQNPPRAIAVVSGNHMEGKTFIVCNLGMAMAHAWQKVLIIDADLRSPKMHHMFNLENRIGLSTLLTDAPLEEKQRAGIVQKTAVPGLHVMTSGPVTLDPAHLLYSPQLQSFLASIRWQYDMVLFDTPASLRFADARIVARLCDAVVFVTRAGFTTREEVSTLHEQFSENNTRILGSILNEWDLAKSSGV